MNYSTDFQNRETILQAAKEQRERKQFTTALATLAGLEVLHPDFSRLHQERGQCHALLGDTRAAIASLEEAVRLNPTLPASWDMLEQLYRMAGDGAQASAAAQKLEILRQLPREVVVANSLFTDGDLELAEQVLRDYLRQAKTNVGAQRLLARISYDRGALAEADDLLEEALEQAPDYNEARFDLAAVLLHREDYARAQVHAEYLVAADPANRAYLKQYGAACIGLGDYEPIIGLYEKLLAEGTQSADETAELRLWRANALKTTGRSEEAIADYRRSLIAQPDQAVAWFALANLKTYRFSDDEITQMSAAECRPGVPEVDRTYLCFALGKAFEDRSDYERSWRYYERGNAIRYVTSHYRPDPVQRCANELSRHLTRDFFAARADYGLEDASPIFIVGLPRSGSTLLEQILASHSQVEGTQELSEMGRIAAELCESNVESSLPVNIGALRRLSAMDAKALGERYINRTRAYRRTDRPHFIDKMPGNFWHVGLIRLILPNAKIIDVRRDPMACCFSNLKQLYGGSNQEFSYKIEDVSHYYRAYLTVMRHWDRVLPERVFRIHYEDLVDDLEGSVRGLLSHCGLGFEPECLAFYQNRRSVRTPSAEQVRQPIGRQGLDGWRHYEAWLGSLQAALGDAVTRYRA